MINLLVQGIMGIAGDAISGFVETKKAKAKQKLVKIQAETRIKEKKSVVPKLIVISYFRMITVRNN